MRSLPIIAAFAAGMLAACSKSPIDSATSAANAVGMKLMAPAMQKDASHQAEGLIRALASRPECQEFINRLREAGHAHPTKARRSSCSFTPTTPLGRQAV